jgi:predicted ATPase/DNA-binding SARP family transcriptional activator
LPLLVWAFTRSDGLDSSPGVLLFSAIPWVPSSQLDRRLQPSNHQARVTMSEQLEIRALGGLTIKRNSTPVTVFDSKKVAALLVYLVATGRTYPRETLAEFFWEGRTQSRSLANLRVALTSLRQTVGPFVDITRESVSLARDAAVWLDAAAFEDHLNLMPDVPLATLEEAIDLYRGDFLEGFYVDSDVFEAWARLERERLRFRIMDALDRFVMLSMDVGRFADGITQATRLLQMDPLREETHCQLMRLMAQSGQRVAALEHYAHCTQLLADELGIEPAPETTMLYTQIQAGEIATERPRRRAQIDRPPPPRHNLPPQPTPFIGREREIAQIITRLTDPACRVLTLTGTGGIGKTRLALEVAARVADRFADGVWYVRLAMIQEAALVADITARALGVTEVPGQPIADTLKHFLAAKDLLLVLDNFEHVMAAALLVSDLAASAPGLKLLLTSREVLRLYGERAYAVPPLGVPDLATYAPGTALAEYEAVALFEQRARAVRPDFALHETNAPVVAEVCARLDGLPLAIELAAARIKLFTPDALLQRLDERFKLLIGGARDRPARMQTLRQTIDWSYDLLTEAEKTLFARLAVFQGGCTLEAAEAVCGPELGHEVIEGLESLLDKSLIQQETDPEDSQRFVFLESTHHYACERLEASGEADELHQRHAAYFLDMLEQAEQLIGKPEWFAWVNRLTQDYQNVYTMLAWAFETDNLVRVFHRIASPQGMLFLYWWNQQLLSDWDYWLQRALARSADAPPELRWGLLGSAGQLAILSGEKERAVDTFRRALELVRVSGDMRRILYSLLGIALSLEPDEFDQARAYLEEVLELAQGTEHALVAATAANNLGEIARQQGNYVEAGQLYEKSIAIRNELGLTRHSTHMNLAFVALFQGDYEAARAAFSDKLRLAHKIGNRIMCCVNLIGLAGVNTVTGHQADAARLFGTVDAVRDTVAGFDLRVEAADHVEYTRYLALTREQLATFGLPAIGKR